MSMPFVVPAGELDPAPGELPEISGWGRFVSADWERRFRLDGLRSERRALYLVAAVASAAFLVFVLNDNALVSGSASARLALLVGRALVVGLCATVALYAARRSHPIDVPLTVVTALVLFGEIMIATTRPAGFVGHVALELIAVLGVYLLLPLPFAPQAGLALAATGGHLTVLLGLKHGVSVPTLLALSFGFVAVNLLGAVFSRQSNIARRQAFAFAQRERELREQVEHAVATAAALRELLPICSSCKRVRDTRGDWHELDRFLAKRELARFSHGVCEVCATKLYPELSEEGS